MTTPELTDEEKEEQLRIKFQTALQQIVYDFVSEGGQPHIALQEVSRLVGDVLYRIIRANQWADNTERVTALIDTASKEISFSFTSLLKADPESHADTETVIRIDGDATLH